MYAYMGGQDLFNNVSLPFRFYIGATLYCLKAGCEQLVVQQCHNRKSHRQLLVLLLRYDDNLLCL